MACGCLSPALWEIRHLRSSQLTASPTLQGRRLARFASGRSPRGADPAPRPGGATARRAAASAEATRRDRSHSRARLPTAFRFAFFGRGPHCAPPRLRVIARRSPLRPGACLCVTARPHCVCGGVLLPLSLFGGRPEVKAAISARVEVSSCRRYGEVRPAVAIPSQPLLPLFFSPFFCALSLAVWRGWWVVSVGREWAVGC